MSVKVLYSTTAQATGGRDGEAGTLDGKFHVKLSRPKELHGAGGDGLNPEQLFATGYAACFLSSIKAAAGPARIDIPPDASVVCTIGIGPRSDAPGLGLAAQLRIELPGIERTKSEALVSGAHKLCPYSNAIHNNVEVKIEIV